MVNLKYPIKCRYYYVPTYYVGLNDSQKKIQDIVLDFKKGKYGSNAKEWFADQIIDIIGNDSDDWIVSFVPASNDENYSVRFTKLFLYLCDTVRCKVLYSLLMLGEDKIQSSTDKSIRITKDDILVRQESLEGKNIILIDDVITSGNTFTAAAQALEDHGVKSVYGLFFAKTIHPSRLSKKPLDRSHANDFAFMDDVIQDMKECYDPETWEYLNNLPLEDK